MDIYNKVSNQTTQIITNHYSTSFSLASKLFSSGIRQDVYNIYALVRVADEIVDTYQGKDKLEQIKDFETEVYASLSRKFSTNPVLHAFQSTARRCRIDKALIAPFFFSMKLDTSPQVYDQKLYQKYIEGSAEVVGLMCLKVFITNPQEFENLEPGARALGSAFQKVNFLRDMASDHHKLDRFYFPESSYESFDEQTKKKIISDIEQDFAVALPAIKQLPKSAQTAVYAAYRYYSVLLQKLKAASVDEIKTKRIRVNNVTKLSLLSKMALSKNLRR